MNYLLKHLKSIACFLAALILFQSCVTIYKNKPTPLAEVPVHGDTHIKIKTIDHKKYRVRWIEEKDGNIVSIRNTIRHFIDTTAIEEILVFEPTKVQIHYTGNLDRTGPFEIRTKKDRYKFIKIELRDQYIIGYEKDGEKTDLIEIPKDQILEIKLPDKPLGGFVTALIYIGSYLGIMALLASQIDLRW